MHENITPEIGAGFRVQSTLIEAECGSCNSNEEFGDLSESNIQLEPDSDLVHRQQEDNSNSSDQDMSLISIISNVSNLPQIDGNDSLSTSQSQTQATPTLEVVRSQHNLVPGERRAITDRLSPEVPEPVLVIDIDADGWCLIDQVGGWHSYLCEFPILEDIPSQHRGVWTWAWNYILDRINNALNPTDLNRALMWLLFLPQALLRQPKRGGRSGRNLTAQRFNALVKGDWGLLVKLWEKDKIFAQEKRLSQKSNSQRIISLDSKCRNAVNLISQGQVSKAANRINSHGVADINERSVMQQVQSKYPARGRPLPETISLGKPVEGLRDLRESLLQLERGKSPGTGGLRAEFLVVLAEMMTEQQMEMLEEFGMKYLSGDLPAWFYEVWLSVMTVPLFKNEKLEAVRPIGIRNPLVRHFHKEVVSQNKSAFVDYLEPEQLAMSVAGGGKLVFSIRMLAEDRTDFIVVKIDMKNAINDISRASIIEALEEEPSLNHLAWHAATILAPSTGLETGGYVGEARLKVQHKEIPLVLHSLMWHGRGMSER